MRCLSRVSLEGETAETGGSLLCLLLLHHAYPSQERAKQKTLGITGEVHRRLFTKRRNFKELEQLITLLSIAFAFCQTLLNTYLCNWMTG